ncbi:MAG: hypothetical protein LKH78_03290 [Weizmannia coagulans]|jgi:hypothetical protein|nr:hypothetical protein [Heyndrickxia coagulans]
MPYFWINGKGNGGGDTGGGGTTPTPTRPVNKGGNGKFLGGDGTVGNPYLVGDPADLNAVRNNLSAYYKQVCDIDMSEFGNWIPIGNDPGFRGYYNGNGYKIDNLICEQTTDYAGLFGVIGTGRIENVNLENAKITGGNNVGGICGSGGVIKNCRVDGSISGYNYVGGICGYSGSIHVCYVTGSVTGNTYVGGISGNLADCYNCFVLLDKICRIAVSTKEYFGDIKGGSGGTITNCYSLDTLEFRQL